MIVCCVACGRDYGTGYVMPEWVHPGSAGGPPVGGADVCEMLIDGAGVPALHIHTGTGSWPAHLALPMTPAPHVVLGIIQSQSMYSGGVSAGAAYNSSAGQGGDLAGYYGADPPALLPHLWLVRCCRYPAAKTYSVGAPDGGRGLWGLARDVWLARVAGTGEAQWRNCIQTHEPGRILPLGAAGRR